MKKEITLISDKSKVKNPSFRQSDASVVQSVAERYNKKVSNSIVSAEILQMFVLRNRGETYTMVADMVQENNGTLKQTHGGDIWSLVDGYRPVPTDATRYDDPDETKQMEVFCPPKLYDFLNREYGKRGWMDVINKAVGQYVTQPFFSLNHVLEVQHDIIQENYDTDIGQWYRDKDEPWYETMDADMPRQWGTAYQSHLTGNIPRDDKITWIEAAFSEIYGNNVITRSNIESQLNDEFGESEKEARRKADEVDIDKINDDWYSDIQNVLDSDIRELVSGASGIIDMMKTDDEDDLFGVGALSGIEQAPEVSVPDDEKARATRLATSGINADIGWHDLTWQSRVRIAHSAFENEYNHKDPADIGQGSDDVDGVESRMDAINSVTGDNQ